MPHNTIRRAADRRGQALLELIIAAPVALGCLAALIQLALNYHARCAVQFAAWHAAKAAALYVPHPYGQEPAYSLQPGGDRWEVIRSYAVVALVPISPEAPRPAVSALMGLSDPLFRRHLALAAARRMPDGYYVSRYRWASQNTTLTLERRSPETGAWEEWQPPDNAPYSFDGGDQDLTVRVDYLYPQLFPVMALLGGGLDDGALEISARATLPMEGELLRKPQPQEETP